jgi:hypothetical protein
MILDGGSLCSFGDGGNFGGVKGAKGFWRDGLGRSWENVGDIQKMARLNSAYVTGCQNQEKLWGIVRNCESAGWREEV